MRPGARTAVLTALGTVALLVVGFVLFVYSGAYNVAATSGHMPLTAWVLNTTQERSVAVRADDVPEPPAADSSSLAHGFEHFDAMCVQCHGAPGVARGELGEGITPTPPPLEEEAPEYSARELFWITKHGIKMAGMPAFGPTHSDEEIWGIVAFLEELPELGEEGYAAWRGRTAAPADGGQAEGGHSHPQGTAPHGH